MRSQSFTLHCTSSHVSVTLDNLFSVERCCRINYKGVPWTPPLLCCVVVRLTPATKKLAPLTELVNLERPSCQLCGSSPIGSPSSQFGIMQNNKSSIAQSDSCFVSNIRTLTCDKRKLCCRPRKIQQVCSAQAPFKRFGLAHTSWRDSSQFLAAKIRNHRPMAAQPLLMSADHFPWTHSLRYEPTESVLATTLADSSHRVQLSQGPMFRKKQRHWDKGNTVKKNRVKSQERTNV